MSPLHQEAPRCGITQPMYDMKFWTIHICPTELIGPVDGDGHCGVDGAGHERVGGGEEVGRHVRQHREGVTENEGRK